MSPPAHPALPRRRPRVSPLTCLALGGLLAGGGVAWPAVAQPTARVAVTAATPHAGRAVRRLAVGVLAEYPAAGLAAQWQRALGNGGVALALEGGATIGGARRSGTRHDGQPFTARLAVAQVVARWFVGGAALQGLSVGMLAGVLHEREQFLEVDGRTVDPTTGQSAPEPSTRPARLLATARLTAPTVGSTIDYDLALGRDGRLVLGTGLAFRRVLGDARSDVPGTALLAPRVRVAPRLQVGVRF